MVWTCKIEAHQKVKISITFQQQLTKWSENDNGSGITRPNKFSECI